MGTDTFDPRELLAERNLGVLATLHRDGRAQLSPVTPFYEPAEERIHISTRAGLVKANNLLQDPRAALNVTSADGRSWATAEGTATLTGPGDDPHGPVVEALVEYYRKAAGEHPDWAEYRTAMVTDRRVLLTIEVQHVYGATLRG